MPFGGMYGYLGDYAVLWLMLISLIVHTWCFFRFFPKAKQPRLRLVLGNVLICSCMLGVVAMSAESYLRFICVRTDSFGVSLPARKWFALHAHLNSFRCRDDEWKFEKPAGVRRIAFVGDSFTYGWGVENVADRFADQIGARLNKEKGARFEVMNVAIPGWGTGDQLVPIKDVIDRYHADEIVLCYVFNDIEKLLPREQGFNPTRPPESSWFNPDSSALVDWMFRTIVVPRVPTVMNYHDWIADGYATPQFWSLHQQQLIAIRDACTERGVTFRVALLPFIRVGGTKFDRDQLHEQMRQFLESKGVAVVDLRGSIAGQDPRTLVVNGMDAHPNVKAHRLFADAMWAAWSSEWK